MAVRVSVVTCDGGGAADWELSLAALPSVTSEHQTGYCHLGKDGSSQVQVQRLQNEYHFCTIRASQVVLVAKNPPANAGAIRDMGSILGLGRSPGGRNGSLLQYSCLENPMDKEPGGLACIGSQRVGYN